MTNYEGVNVILNEMNQQMIEEGILNHKMVILRFTPEELECDSEGRFEPTVLRVNPIQKKAIERARLEDMDLEIRMKPDQLSLQGRGRTVKRASPEIRERKDGDKEYVYDEEEVLVKLTEYQAFKLKTAAKQGNGASVVLGKDQLDAGEHGWNLNLTKSQKSRIATAKRHSKGTRLELQYYQIKHFASLNNVGDKKGKKKVTSEEEE